MHLRLRQLLIISLTGLALSSLPLTAQTPPPLATDRPGFSTGPATVAQRLGDAGKGELHYARIEFQDQLTGNAKLRDLRFSNRVRCVYGQVQSWDEVVTDGTSRGNRGAELGCQTLRLSEVRRGADRAMFLDASGNVLIQSQHFDARAAKLTFDQLKDLMVLDGDPRGGAELRYSPPGRANVVPMVAQRIKFWPKEMKVDVEGFNSIVTQR